MKPSTKSFVLTLLGFWLIALGVLESRPAMAQERDTAYIQSIVPFGTRAFVRNRWGAYRFNAINPTDRDRELIVTTYHDRNSTEQYAKRFWIPARSRTFVWMPFFAGLGQSDDQTEGAVGSPDRAAPGLAMAQPSDKPIGGRAWVVDVLDGVETPVPLVTGELQMDAEVRLAMQEMQSGYIDDDIRFGDENRNMTYEALVALRNATRNTRRLTNLIPGEIPTNPGVLRTFDNLLIATDDLFLDTGLIQAVKAWVLKGGRLWLMLDKVSPEVAAQFFDNAAVVEYVDDTTFNRFTLEPVDNPSLESTSYEVEEPLTMRRMIVEGADVEFEIDGWPALFWVPAGRGKILATTMEARGWVRRFAERDIEAGMESRRAVSVFQANMFQTDFVLIDPMKPIADEFFFQANLPMPKADVSRQFAIDEIGYAIPTRGLVGSVLAGFCVLLIVGGVALIKLDLARWMIIVAPGLAILTAVILGGIGATNRTQVPDTISQLQYIRLTNGSPEIDVETTGSVYVSSAGVREVASESGELLRLKRTAANNELRQMTWTDEDQWTMSNVELPAGQTLLSQPGVESLERPVRANASFAPNGLVGKLDVPGTTSPSTGVLVYEQGFAPVAFDSPTDFRIDASQRLADGQFVVSEVLSDQDRKRQEFYRKLFLEQGDWEIKEPVLFFWDEPRAESLAIDGVETSVGAALYSVALRFDKPEPGTRVEIPRALIRMRTSDDIEGDTAVSLYSWRSGEWVEKKSELTACIRFKVPDSLKPFELERVNLRLRLRADDRQVEILAVEDGTLKTIQTLDSPREVMEFVFDRSSQLGLNKNNEWVIGLKVTNKDGRMGLPEWKVEDLDIEMRGTTTDTNPGTNQ